MEGYRWEIVSLILNSVEIGHVYYFHVSVRSAALSSKVTIKRVFCR